MLGYLAKGIKFADGIDVTHQLAWRREIILIIQVGPVQPHGGGRQQREALWRRGAMNPEMPAIPRSWKRGDGGFSPGAPAEGRKPCGHLDFNPERPTLDV